VPTENLAERVRQERQLVVEEGRGAGLPPQHNQGKSLQVELGAEKQIEAGALQRYNADQIRL